MISRQDLRDLLSDADQNGSKFLSVYLNVDQGRAVNLNRGFEAALRSGLKGVEGHIDQNDQEGFEVAARAAVSFVADYQPDGKAIVLFSNAKSGLSWHRSLGIPLENDLHWSPHPVIRPLLEARDEFERYGVVLADRAHARLFTQFLGSIQEEKETLAEAEVRRFDASGSDQMRSQMHFQRKADEHAKRHLKNVADLMDKLGASERFDRLVLGGPQEAVSELKNLLSDRLKKALVGILTLPLDASLVEIQKEVMRLQVDHERAGERELVESLLTDAAKKNRAVTGLDETLAALHEGRIHRLVYTGQFQPGGSECPECSKVFQSDRRECPYCESELRPLNDLLDAIAVEVFKEGGEIEHVQGDAADRLNRDGKGIGAHLRF